MIIRIVDLNPSIIDVAKRVFEDVPGVEIYLGDMIHQQVDAWVTPTNSRGIMSGGLDLAIKNYLGYGIQDAVRKEIKEKFGGYLPVGRAVVVHCPSTGGDFPRFLVSTPTMEGENDDLRRTRNTAWACAAAFQAIYELNEKSGEPIKSIAIPGLGAGTGRIDPEICAELLLVGFRLFKRKRYTSFEEMSDALNEELGDIGLHKVADTVGTEENSELKETFDSEAKNVSNPKVKSTNEKPEVTDKPAVYKIEVKKGPSHKVEKMIKQAPSELEVREGLRQAFSAMSSSQLSAFGAVYGANSEENLNEFIERLVDVTIDG
jgi:O-acetyl-ADP-ribose deacetylase (regulator of RNase III)